MSAQSVEVSVVLPAYNEADTIEDTVGATLDRLAAFLPPDSFEVLVAEDGCDDRTPEIAAKLAAAHDRVRHVHSDRRLGRGGALQRAFRAADGSTLAYFDTDMATDMDHLEELIESVRSGEYDIATGSRWISGHEADRPVKRGVSSRGYNWLVRLLLRSDLQDHQCGFKAFDRTALLALLDDVEDDHWFWDTEVLVHAQRAGYRVREFPVEWTPKGDTKVDFVRDVLGMGSQILRTWWQLSVRPRISRRVSITAGLALTVLALGLMTLYIDPENVGSAFTSADPVLVAVAALVYVVSWPIRGARYRDILAELGFRERVGFLTGAVFISQTGNLVFPARAGDAVRAYVIKARRGIPYPSGFASLAAERVFDLLTITVLAGSVLVGLVVTDSTGELARTVAGNVDALAAGGEVITPAAIRQALTVAAVVGALAVVAVLAIAASTYTDRDWIRAGVRRVSTDSYAEYVAGVLERFVGDLQTAAGNRAAFGRIGLSSLAIWTLDVLTAMVVLAAFGTGIALPTLVAVSFFAVSVGNLAKVLPLSPGGIGLYEAAFTALVVAVAGVPPATAFAASVLDHAVKNLVTVAGGVGSMAWLNVSLTTAVEESADTPETADPATESD